MLDKIKLGVLLWGAIFLLICFFVTIVLWFLFSIWWVITNNMVDRNLFILLSLGISKLVSLSFFVLGLLPEKNKNTLSI